MHDCGNGAGFGGGYEFEGGAFCFEYVWFDDLSWSVRGKQHNWISVAVRCDAGSYKIYFSIVLCDFD